MNDVRNPRPEPQRHCLGFLFAMQSDRVLDALDKVIDIPDIGIRTYLHKMTPLSSRLFEFRLKKPISLGENLVLVLVIAAILGRHCSPCGPCCPCGPFRPDGPESVLSFLRLCMVARMVLLTGITGCGVDHPLDVIQCLLVEGHRVWVPVDFILKVEVVVRVGGLVVL